MESNIGNRLYNKMMKLIDQGYDLMAEYDSLTHRYGDVILYQSEAKMIQYIGNHEGTTITAIASETGKTASAYSQVIRKLKKKDFVKQVRNEENAREYKLYLTEKGAEIFEAHDQFEQFCYQRMFEKLEEFTEKDLEVYCRIQEKLNEAYAIDVEESNKSGLELADR